MNITNVIENSVLAIIVFLAVYVLLLLLPIATMAKANCLEHGYPESAIVWNLKTYCINLEGSVSLDSLNAD